MSDDAAAAEESNAEQNDATLGSRLRIAREARDLSIEKIADELRIEEHVLFALEEDRLSDIRVAPVFIKGYIKQYGRLLELDYEELRAAFRRQTDSEDIRLRPNKSILLRDERQIKVWVITALAVLVVGVALLVWWLSAADGPVSLSRNDSGTTGSASVAAPLTTRTLPDASEAPTGQPAQTEVTRAAAAPVEAPPVAVDIAQTVALATAPVDAVPAVVAEPEVGAVAMTFVFAEESWFELTDARGRRLYYDLAQAGTRHSFQVLPPAQVLLGNASAVSISVAADEFAVPNSGRRGNVAIFAIDPAQD